MESPTGGVKPMAIEGRMARERERLIGMTDEERAWRKQWIQDQKLSSNEPRHVPELEEELMNPIRRFYRRPLDMLYEKWKCSMGHDRAYQARFWLGKILLVTAGIYSGFYYFKYNANNWTSKNGWRIISSRKSCNPGDEGFPMLSDRKKPVDYADRGFKASVLFTPDKEEEEGTEPEVSQENAKEES